MNVLNAMKCTLKMAKLVNFMLYICIYFHNQRKNEINVYKIMVRLTTYDILGLIK